MPTQLTLAGIASEYHILKCARLDVTARERFQAETVETIAAMLRRERELLKQVRKEKREAEDKAELFRAANDLEV